MDRNDPLFDSLLRRLAGRLPASELDRCAGLLRDAPAWTERKTLTLLFVDAGAAQDDPRAQQQFEGELEWLAARHQGLRDRFAPAGALVFFEQATQCVAMALALQRAAAWLRVRMGVTTASCRVATFSIEGEAFVTLLGAEAELAARVAASASAGSILISPATYALVRDAVHAGARDCLLAEEYQPEGATATIMPTPARGGVQASTFAGLGLASAWAPA